MHSKPTHNFTRGLGYLKVVTIIQTLFKFSITLDIIMLNVLCKVTGTNRIQLNYLHDVTTLLKYVLMSRLKTGRPSENTSGNNCSKYFWMKKKNKENLPAI